MGKIKLPKYNNGTIIKTKLCFPQGKIRRLQTGNRRYPLNLGQYLSYAASFWLNVSIHAVVLSEVTFAHRSGGRFLLLITAEGQLLQWVGGV